MDPMIAVMLIPNIIRWYISASLLCDRNTTKIMIEDAITDIVPEYLAAITLKVSVNSTDVDDMRNHLMVAFHLMI